MEQDTNPDIKDVFATLPVEGQKLLIAMTHASHKIGMRMDAISATSELEGEKLEKALTLLQSNNLVERGKRVNHEFVLDKEGIIYRLPLAIRKSVLLDIVKLDKKVVEDLLKDYDL